MAKATTYANDVLDQEMNNGASGSPVVGSSTYVLPFKMHFFSTLCVAGTAGTEWTGGSYAAVAINGLLTAAASAAAKASTGAITVTNAPSTTWADNEVQDSTGTPKRVAFKGTPSLGKTVNLGDTATIPSGSFTGTEV